MKKAIAITSLALACAATVPVTHAGTTEVKQGAVFTTSTIAGAVLGGPVGFFLGALGGAYMGEQIEKADKADETAWVLSEAEAQIALLNTELAKANGKVNELAQAALDKLEFQVLFHTGADQLTERDRERVTALGQFLLEHPQLNVRLIGHADPRGTDEYNKVLSDQRAIAVQEALAAYGIDSRRIERRAYGASQSNARQGDHEAYALERRVDIEIFSPSASLAQVE